MWATEMMIKLTFICSMIAMLSVLPSCMSADASGLALDGDDFDEDTDLNSGTDLFDDSYFPQTQNQGNAVAAPKISAEEVPADVCQSEVDARYLQFRSSRSTGGPVLTREAVASGFLPQTPVRDEEFLSYYNAGYPAPDGDVPILEISGIQSLDAKGQPSYALQTVLLTRNAEKDTRRSLNLVIAVDTSASMSGEGMTRAKAVCKAFPSILKPGDVVFVIGWDDAISELLVSKQIEESDDSDINSACDSLAAHGSKGTAIHTGLVAAYNAAMLTAEDALLNRIVFISDGGAIAGVSDKSLIASYAKGETTPPIYLTTIGVASSFAQYNESLMRTFAEAGSGDHYYVDSTDEADRVIRDRFAARVETTGDDSAIQLVLPPGWRIPDDLLVPGVVDSETASLRIESGSTWILRTPIVPCEASATAADQRASLLLSYYTPSDPAEIVFQTSAYSTAAFGVEASTDIIRSKADLVVAYADAVRAAKTMDPSDALSEIDAVAAEIELSLTTDNGDADLEEMHRILGELREIVSE